MADSKPLRPVVRPAIGVDLGTTFTKVGVGRNGRVSLADLGGTKAMPSVVAIHQDHFFALPGTPLNEKHIVIGEPALRLQNVPGWIVVFDSKRFLGRVMNDAYTSAIQAMNLPFQVVANEVRKAVFRVIFNTGAAGINGEYRNVLPQVVSAHVLRRTVRQVSDRYGFDPKLPVPVVITIPAAFNDMQRHATYEAANIAGLEVLQLLPEPSAAAVAFLMDKNENGIFLVFDFGGGTHDVSLVEVKGNSFVVKGIAGDTLLGGRDVDEAIFDMFVLELRDKQIPVHVESAAIANQFKIAKALVALRSECVKAKQAMAFNDEYLIRIEDLYEGEYTGTLVFTREKLSRVLNMPRPTPDRQRISILSRLFLPVNRVLEEAKMEMKQLSGVILAGGSCHLLPVQDQCRQVFTVKHGVPIMVDESMDVDHLVGIGASLVAQTYMNGTTQRAIAEAAAIPTDASSPRPRHDTVADGIVPRLPVVGGSDADHTNRRASSGESKDENKNALTVADVLPDSEGLEVKGDRLVIMLRRNQQYPCSFTDTFVTCYDNQTSVAINVYAGENPTASQNLKLDSTTLSGLPSLPAGEAKVEVTYAVNSSGIMEVTARDQSNAANVGTVVIAVNRGGRMDEKKMMEAVNGVAIPLYASREIENAFHALTTAAYKLKNKLSSQPVPTPHVKSLLVQLQPVLQFVHAFHGPDLSLTDIAARHVTLDDIEKQLIPTATTPPGGIPHMNMHHHQRSPSAAIPVLPRAPPPRTPPSSSTPRLSSPATPIAA